MAAALAISDDGGALDNIVRVGDTAGMKKQSRSSIASSDDGSSHKLRISSPKMTRAPLRPSSSEVARLPAASSGMAMRDLARPGLVRNSEGIRKPFATYPGSKDANGSAQRILGMFPPHSLYVEACLGGGAMLRRKTPALRSIGIEDDPKVIARWRAVKWPGLELVKADAIKWLEDAASWIPHDALVYVDPPYPMETRRGRRYYRNEWSMKDHARLLAALKKLPCSVVVSSYKNDLYARELKGWHHESWRAQTRGGPRIEHAWSKRSIIARYGEEIRGIGKDFRDRERLKRKAHRWKLKFGKMPPRERAAILAELVSVYACGSHRQK